MLNAACTAFGVCLDSDDMLFILLLKSKKKLINQRKRGTKDEFKQHSFFASVCSIIVQLIHFQTYRL